MDHVSMPTQVFNQQPQDITRRTPIILNELNHLSLDQHLFNDKMLTKENGETLFKSVLINQEHIEDSFMNGNMLTSEYIKTEAVVESKTKLKFSVDRLLNASPRECRDDRNQGIIKSSNNNNCCDNISNVFKTGQFDCCKYFLNNQNILIENYKIHKHMQGSRNHQKKSGHFPSNVNIKSIVRPTPIRALNNGRDEVVSCSTMASSFPKYQQQHSQIPQPPPISTSIAALSSLMAPFSGLKSLQFNQQHFLQHTSIQLADTSQDIPRKTPNGSDNVPGSMESTHSSGVNGNNGKRKRSWSRAVFSNLQRKGLEIQFQQQKYITKPDRRKLAARLNLTDAQVKVWFQNRRMKWRHTRENLKSGQEKPVSSQNPRSANSNTVCSEGKIIAKKCYTSSSDVDEDEIDVVE